MTGSQTYALCLGLGPVPAVLEEVRDEIGDRLDRYQPRLSQRPSELELSLTVVAGDLWSAVLLALAAVTNTGYPVERLDVRPAAESVARTTPPVSR